ncbi:MAG: hypothetical protein ABFE08_20790 [Armatimonadia bacterium]
MNDLPIPAQWTLFGVQIFTLFVVIAYVRASFNMARANSDAVQEMKRARILQSRPYIVIHAEYDGLWELIIANRGHSAARDVRLSVEPPLKLFDNLDFVDSVVGQQGIPYMAPGTEIRMLMTVPRGLFAEAPSPLLLWTLASDYADEIGSPASKYHEEYVIDLNIYGDIRSINRKNIHDIGKTLEGIYDELRGIGRAMKRP